MRSASSALFLLSCLFVLLPVSSVVSETPEEAYNHAAELIKQKRYEDAIPFLDHAIELNPSFAEAYYQRAYAYHELGNLDRALQDYNRTIELAPTADAYLQRGAIFGNSRQYQKAIADYDAAIRISPDLTLAYSNRCRNHALLFQHQKAAADAVTYLEKDGWRGARSFAVIVAYFSYLALNQQETATDIATRCAESCDSSIWPYPVIRLFRGEIQETELLGLSKNHGELSESHVFLAYQSYFSPSTAVGKALHGDPYAAEHIDWVLKNDTQGNFSYELALALSELVKGINPKKPKQ